MTPRGQIPLGEPQSVEEKIEYRDEEGNLLNEEQVAALQGKVSFSTRYETRTRLVDDAGNEVYEGLVDSRDGPAPPKPEGVDPKTPQGRDAGEAESSTADVADDLRKEQKIQDAQATAEPASEAEIKTDAKDEL